MSDWRVTCIDYGAVFAVKADFYEEAICKAKKLHDTDKSSGVINSCLGPNFREVFELNFLKDPNKNRES